MPVTQTSAEDPLGDDGDDDDDDDNHESHRRDNDEVGSATSSCPLAHDMYGRSLSGLESHLLLTMASL